MCVSLLHLKKLISINSFLKHIARKFDAAEYFDTFPSLVGNRQNRLKKDTLKNHKISFAGTKAIKKQRNTNLRELSKRIDRVQVLESARQELTTQKHLLVSFKIIHIYITITITHNPNHNLNHTNVGKYYFNGVFSYLIKICSGDNISVFMAYNTRFIDCYILIYLYYV